MRGSPNESSSLTTRAAVTELYDAYSRRDFDRVAAMIDEDVDWIIYGPVQVFSFAGHRFAWLDRSLVLGSGLVSLCFGIFICYHVGFLNGLFSRHPHWTPI